MKLNKKRILISLAVIIVAFILFLFWYKGTYSMGIAASFELNDPSLEKRVLIATQDSPFKNEVVDSVIAQIKSMPAYIRVIDVTELRGIKPEIWTAIVILHTWEMGEPQKDAKAFIDRAKRGDLIVLATSGDGGYRIEGIDGLTSASLIIDVPRCSDIIARRIRKKIESPAPEGQPIK